MNTFCGKSINKGYVIGKIKYFCQNQYSVSQERIDDCEAEIARYESAKEVAKQQLKGLYAKAVDEVGESKAMIFEAHAMILDGAEFSESVRTIISTECTNAEYAVSQTGERLAAVFSQMNDEYFKARSFDIKDIADRVIHILQNTSSDEGIDSVEDIGLMNGSDEAVILVAEDLTPSEAIQLDKSKILSFVTRLGSVNSHTAIIARTMNLPSLTGIDVDISWDGKMAIVDADAGKLIVDPDEVTLEEYEAIIAGENADDELRKGLIKELKGMPDVTLSGREIKLYANIGNTEDVADVLQNDAAGVGLFRSEFLFLGRESYPTEEEQFEIYREVAQKMDGKPVIIRTLDVGSDKQADYLGLAHEENPALGYRGIRVCLDREDIFKQQLRAIYRAAVYGKIAIMFPMISSFEEVHTAKLICEEVKKELQRDKITYGDVLLGIMVETPAAVMISDILTKEVDFLSIGTNDLTQFTMAADRQNPKVDMYYNQHHEAIIRMIKMVIDNGHANGCWVGICGELAVDTSFTEQLIEMGIDELSVPAANILSVRKKIRELS